MAQGWKSAKGLWTSSRIKCLERLTVISVRLTSAAYAFSRDSARATAPRRMAAEVKTEAGAPSDELAALRDSELRMQQRLTEQRRRESKVVLRAAVCESEKRKLSETVAGLQRAVQPAQKQVLPPAPCPCPTRVLSWVSYPCGLLGVHLWVGGP